MTALATGMLERNLRALGRASPDVARRVAETPPRPDARALATDEPGALCLELGHGEQRRALCSRRRPREEAAALVEPVDIGGAAVFLVSGFGAGHHVRALAQRLNKTGVIVVFEPDLGLLRAALEQADCSDWLGSMNIALVDDPSDTAALARIVEGIEGLVAMGVTLVEHPPSRERLGEQTRLLHDTFVDIVKSVKMTVTTTLVQVRTTLANLTQNLGAYTASPGVAELAGACAGRPAIVVSAGPSLERNVALLEDPSVRRRCVLVAVQTVLRPLLARGIRPHFVTALDYSAISTRFYEGLTAADVRGITLVIDPKVNPAVVDAWSRLGGQVRVQGDKHLDKLLGPDLARDKGSLPAGATVAHLAYYLARHLGCDPVALIGQDLGFTDGQYYAAGAAIHDVWACELNAFRTLETLEWERILRMGGHLRKAADILGRPIYTDEQMATYLLQFERDFAEAAARGLTTIDATEGGVRKQHAPPMVLAEFLSRHAPEREGPTIEALLDSARSRARSAAPGARRVQHRVAAVRDGARRVADCSRRAGVVIAEMLEHHRDQARVNRLIERLERVRDEAVGVQPAFDLVQTLNQAGVFNRLRADRALQVEDNAGSLTPLDRQRRQLERDAENVEGLARSAEDLSDLLDEALAALRTGRHPLEGPGLGVQASGPAPEPRASPAIGRIVPLYADQAHGAEVLRGGRTVLECTLDRLAAMDGRTAGTSITVLAGDPALAARALRRSPPGVDVNIVRAPAGFGARRRAVLAARAPARECWRGGIAGQSVYDEVFDIAALREVFAAGGLDAALLCGADWAAVDPALCNRVIERHRATPGGGRFTFTQAAPGLCGCVVSRGLLDDFARAEAGSGVFASLGGLLGYIPFSPIVDLINLPGCVAVDPALRDLGARLIADSPRGRDAVRSWLKRAESAATAGEHFTAASHSRERTLEIVGPMGCTAGEATAAIEEFARALEGEPGLVTLRAPSPLDGLDPIDHPDLLEIIRAARTAGLDAHLRTPLTSPRFDAAEVLESGCAIISADLLAASAEGYRAVTARDDWSTVSARFDTLATGRLARGVWSTPWLVARLTRCDPAYADIDPFYSARLLQCGAAVIDPLESPRPGERIAPLPLPALASRRFARARLGARQAAPCAAAGAPR